MAKSSSNDYMKGKMPTEANTIVGKANHNSKSVGKSGKSTGGKSLKSCLGCGAMTAAAKCPTCGRRM